MKLDEVKGAFFKMVASFEMEVKETAIQYYAVIGGALTGTGMTAALINDVGFDKGASYNTAQQVLETLLTHEELAIMGTGITLVGAAGVSTIIEAAGFIRKSLYQNSETFKAAIDNGLRKELLDKVMEIRSTEPQNNHRLQVAEAMTLISHKFDYYNASLKTRSDTIKDVESTLDGSITNNRYSI